MFCGLGVQWLGVQWFGCSVVWVFSGLGLTWFGCSVVGCSVVGRSVVGRSVGDPRKTKIYLESGKPALSFAP